MIISKENERDNLTIEELRYAAFIFADAFSEHENMKKIFTRKRSLFYLFLTFLKVINKKGDIFIRYVDNKPVGYLTFMEITDGGDLNAKHILRYGFSSALQFLLYSLRDLRRVFTYLRGYSSKNEIAGKNIHLLQAAIANEYKGRGYMTELFDMANIRYKDFDAIVLETSDESNVPLYKHLGYEVIQQIDALYIFRKKL